MPRSKQEINAIIKKIKDNINSINKETGAKLSYGKIRADIERMFAMNEAQRDAAIKEYEIAMRKEIADIVLPKRSTIWSNETIAAKESQGILAKYDITIITRNVKLVMNAFCNLMQEDYTATHEMTEEDYKAVRDWEYAELKSHSYHSESPIYMKAWGKEAFIAEASNLDGHFKNENGEINYSFKNEYGKSDSRKDIIAADAYYKTTIIKAELARHGVFWRLFNFRKVAAYNAYISKAEDILARIGFIENEHKDKAIEVLKNTVMVPHDMDEERVKDAYERQMDAWKEKNIKELTVARDSLTKAKALDNNPDTSIYKKLESILEKYDMIAGFEEILKKTAMENAALMFDKQRDISSMKNSAFVCFLRTYDAMIVDAIANGKDINVAEFMEDAKKITDVAMEHYFGISAIDELKDLDRPLYMFDLDLDSVLRRLDMYTNGVNVKNPENPKEYKKVMPIPGVIEKAKEEATAIVNQWLADPGKLLPEVKAPEVRHEEVKQVEVKNEPKPLVNKLSDEARNFGNEMFKIEFRPSRANIANEIKMMTAVVNVLKNSPEFKEDQYAKKIFRANQEKIVLMKNVIKNNGAGADNLQKQFEDIDSRLGNEIRIGYKPRLVSDFEKIAEKKESIVVNLDEKIEEKKEEIQPSINENQAVNDNSYNLFEKNAELHAGVMPKEKIEINIGDENLEKSAAVEDKKENDVAQKSV